MENPLVSIILPTYNREKTIARAINSVLEQTYKNIEIIIVNDASDDSTGKIISEFAKKDQRIVIINNSARMGVAESLNRGIREANGKYIARLDDDDFWCDAKKLEKQVDFLEKNKDYVLVGGGAVEMNQSGKEIARYFFPENDLDIRKKILTRDVFIHVAVFFRKDAWKSAGGYDKKFDGMEDWELWLKMGTIGKFYNFQSVFVCYSGHQYRNSSYLNKTRKITESAMLRIKIIKKYRNYYPGENKAILYALLACAYSFLPFRDSLLPLKIKAKKIFLNNGA